MAVHAQHLVLQRFGRQGVAAQEEAAQVLVNDERLRPLDRAEDTRRAVVGADLQIDGRDTTQLVGPAIRTAAGVIELGVDVQSLALTTAVRMAAASPLATDAKQADILDLHVSLSRVSRDYRTVRMHGHCGNIGAAATDDSERPPCTTTPATCA